MKTPTMSNRITSGYRPLRDGSAYDAYFPKPDESDRVVIEDGAVEDTVELMKKVVWRYLGDTKKIAPIVQAKTVSETAKNIWEFLYHHIQYRLDKRGLEQLRRPARSWAERKSGIDCDCFSIFASSILTNLRIPHFFRIARYSSDYFQHVYVVVPDGGAELIIDPVLSRYNVEKPYQEKKDFIMNLNGIDVAVLSGMEPMDGSSFLGVLENTEFVETSEAGAMDAMYQYLVSTRSAIMAQPDLIRPVEDPESFLKMLDYALEYWYTDKRDEALEVLAQNESLWNRSQGLSSDFEGDDSLGGLKNFFSNVKDFVSKTAAGAKELAKKVGEGIIRYNPISAMSRVGLLAAFKLNLRKISTKVKWGYASLEQAQQKGISSDQWSRAKKALEKIEKLYIDRLKGNPSAIRDAILKGRAGGLNGEPGSYLGEPVTVATSIAAATPVIVAVIKIIQDAGLFKKGEDTSTTNLIKEAESLVKSANIPNLLEDEINQSTSNTMLKPSLIERILSKTGGALPSTKNLPTASALPTGANPTAPNRLVPSTGGSSLSTFIKNNKALVATTALLIGAGTYYLLRKKKSTRPLSGASRVSRSRNKSRGTSSRVKKLNLK